MWLLVFEILFLFFFVWRGVKDVMKKRLKSHYKKQKLMQTAAEGGPTDTYYDYICVVDFEATCEEDNPADFLHEIIEFPMVLISTHTLEIVSVYLGCCCFNARILWSWVLFFCFVCAGGQLSGICETRSKPTALRLLREANGNHTGWFSSALMSVSLWCIWNWSTALFCRKWLMTPIHSQ